MISVVVLGAGAGGGFPQWNSNAAACRRARAGDLDAPSATQTSIAVSADGANWFVLNASPDLRIQIERTAELHPAQGLRSTPIAGVVLSGAEVDAVTGLLSLRESQRFAIYATPAIHARLDANPIFDVLSRDIVPREVVRLDQPQPLALPGGRPSGLVLTAFAVPGKVPLYAEAVGMTMESMSDDETIGLELTDGAHRLLFVPGCAALLPPLRARLHNADCVFFDATLWRDDEMILAGIGTKTGARMGHMSISGVNGVLQSFAGIDVGRRILIHINNSNPILLVQSPERRAVMEAGWNVAFDGMRLML